MNICRDAHRLSFDVAQTSPSRLGSASVADLARAAGATVRFREETTMNVLAALVLGFVWFAAVPALAHDVDGKWTGTVSTPMGDIPVAYEFKADGTTLTRSATWPGGGSIADKRE